VPEGPSIVILREQAAKFERKRILSASSTARIDPAQLIGQRVVALRTWGKHFLVQLPHFSIRIHFLLFGSYLIDEAKPGPAKLSLRFSNGEINFYACSVKVIEQDLDTLYEWSADVMSNQWDPAKARKKLRAAPQMLACDALLDQDVFAGAGNIIKNEVLFRIRVHPMSRIGALPAAKLRQLVDEARRYSFEFLEWKKANVLKRHWRAHTKTICPRCNRPFIEKELGKTKRRSFYCNRCQIKHLITPRTQYEKPL
jgi:endonuclease VIII